MIEQAALAGEAKNGSYSQTLSVGDFFVLLTLTNGDSVDIELGRNTLSKIEDITTQTPEISPAELNEIISEELKDGITVELATAKIGGQKLRLAIKGKIGARLLRGGKIVNLGTGKEIVGPVQLNDLLVVGTTKFWELATARDFSPLLTLSPLEMRDAFLPEVEALADNSGVAAFFVKVDSLEMAEESSASETPLSAKTSRGLGETLSALPGKYLGRLPTPRGMYLARHESLNFPKYRRLLYLAIVILLTLVSVIAFQLRSRALEQKTKVVAAMEKQVAEGIDSSSKLAGVNDNIARDILVQTKKDFLTRAEAEFGKNWQDPKLKTILKNLDEKIAAISHIYQVSDLDLFYDFGLLKSGVGVVSAGLEKNEIFALDGANGAAYSVGTKNKTAKILIGTEELKSGKFIDGIGDKYFIWSPRGIYETEKRVIEPSEKWGEVAGLKTFGGNLYLLDRSSSQVWKYQGAESGFATASAYLRSGSLDFSKVTGFAIDGYIYVLSSSGNVVRFASGYADEFKISGLPDPLSSPTSIFASDETENIYILDSGNARVVVLDKKGGYSSQYLLPASNAVVILADEAVKKAFLIAPDKIYSFDLHTSP